MSGTEPPVSPPSSGPPSGPPSSGPPPGPPSSGRRGALPWIVGGGVALVLAVVVVLVLVLGGSKDAADARSVADVADVAVAAAEDLDVEKGIDLLCAAPSSDERDELEQLIADGKERAGTERPAVDYAISNVADGAEGSFTVTISSDEQGLADSEVSFEVVVATDGDRSCIDALATQDAPIEAG